ncbi:hypothetical protein ABEV74_04850 [Paenibacillus cisolokensis]|uniref:hypothetical protein n=1 Tax=Paenibacillus cisolokensis TaxID=1658519 RepID=UPI003D2E8672
MASYGYAHFFVDNIIVIRYGYVSVDGAFRDYGVIVREDGKGGYRLDADATEAHRSRLKESKRK